MISRIMGRAKALGVCALSAEFAIIAAFIALAAGCEQPRPDLPPRRRVVIPPTATAQPSQPAPAPESATPPAPDANAQPSETPAAPAADADATQPTPSAETPAASTTPAPETPAASTPATPAPTPDPNADPNAVFAAAATAMKNLPSYRVDMEHAMSIASVQGEAKTEIQADVQAPDKMGGSMSVILDGDAPVAMRFVRVGGSEYISPIDPDDPENALWVLGGGESAVAPMSNFFAWFADDSPYEIAIAELVDVEDLDGPPTYRLRGSFAAKNAPNDADRMDAEIWVGTADSHIRKMSAVLDIPNERKLEITAAYSNFADASIQIAPPASFIGGTP